MATSSDAGGFPGRPDTPDFWRFAKAVQFMDALSDAKSEDDDSMTDPLGGVVDPQVLVGFATDLSPVPPSGMLMMQMLPLTEWVRAASMGVDARRQFGSSGRFGRDELQVLRDGQPGTSEELAAGRFDSSAAAYVANQRLLRLQAASGFILLNVHVAAMWQDGFCAGWLFEDSAPVVA